MTGLERMIYRLGLMLILLGLVAACAVQEHKPPGQAASVEPLQEQSADEPDAAEITTQALTKEMLFDILLAEIAGQRGELDVSAPHYLQAAEEAEDPQNVLSRSPCMPRNSILPSVPHVAG